MSGEIVREWHFWLASIAAGTCMAFTYDVLRLLRRLVRHNRFAVDLEDILYWTACFLLSFTMLYYGNNGVIRFAAVLGAAVGMFLYMITVGRFFVRVSLLVLDKTFGSLFRLIRKIIKKLRRLLWPVKVFVIKSFRRLFDKIRLTYTGIRHKMKVPKRRRAQDERERTADGRKEGSAKHKKRKKNKKKNTQISPRQK